MRLKREWRNVGFLLLIISLVILFFIKNVPLVSAACQDPCISISPDTFYFTAVQGGANPSYQNLTISEPTLGGLGPWDSVVTEPWINLIPMGGGGSSSSSVKVKVSTNIAGLTAGNYTGTIYICDSNFPPCDATNSDPGAVAMANVTLTITPQLGFCGNGVCDSGNGENEVSCPQDCQPSCGNGVIGGTEQCDPPLLNSAQCPSTAKTCQTLTCQCVAQCGNSNVDTGEQCDDGNTLNGDGCSSTCQIEIPIGCGDGTTNGAEQCDDANLNNNDACKNDCTNNVCGDGVIYTGIEQCEGTDLNGQTCVSQGFTGGTLSCTASCTFDTGGCTVPPVCVLNSASWDVNQTIEGNVVGLQVITSNCQGQTISFSVRESDVFPLPDTQANVNPANVVVVSDGTATGTWTAEWINDGIGQGNPEYIFTATLISNPGTNIDSSNQLEVLQSSPPLCDTVTTCADYTNQTTCKNDICSVAANSVPSTVDCSTPGTCSCSWNATTSICGPIVKGPTGTCSYTENTADTCDDDGFLTVDWNATWIWDYSSCDSACRVNNEQDALDCQSITETFQCPAQIPLPFFNFYNVLAALVLIAIIYWAISMKKRKKKIGKKAGKR